MLIPPKYSLTNNISQYLSKIEASRAVIESIEIPMEVEINIRRQSSLRSSLFSARIEGNPTTLEELNSRPSDDIKKIEIFNILKAINTLSHVDKKEIVKNGIKTWHKIVMSNLDNSSNPGVFRKEVSAIFNSAGIAIYMPPPPSIIPKFIDSLLEYINSSSEQFVPIRACLSHYSFEKIHPFLDGNGRVGRLLIQSVLKQGGYWMKGLISIEEYLDNHRSTYYKVLEDSENDVTGYLEFMLEAIAVTAENAKQLVLNKKQIAPEDFLLPRRTEILNIIKDHRIVNFDQIRRRFMAVNERTLRYDLKKLTDAGFVKKLGTTKGVYYEAKNVI